jgi:hypothetical protein
MRFNTSEERGFSGIEPAELGEDVDLSQEVFPGSLEELTTIVMVSIDLEEFPASIGTYRGAALSWDLYSFEAQIIELGPMKVSINLAMAEGDSASYFVGLATSPEKFEENADKYQSVLYHTIYTFSPTE